MITLSSSFIVYCLFFFFVQAEDGIRDFHVTGVQTCALPISPSFAKLLEPALESSNVPTRNANQQHPKQSHHAWTSPNPQCRLPSFHLITYSLNGNHHE